MVKFNLTLTTSICVSMLLKFAIIFTVPAEANQKNIVDRVVIEVNRTAYTKRQIEVFHLLRQVFDATGDTEIFPMDEARWQRALLEFQHAMLIEQEAQRLGSFRPVRRAIDAAFDVYLNRRELDQNFAKHVEKLEIDQKTLIQTVTTILRLEAFLLSKQRQGVSHRDFVQEPWFKEIVERSFLRYFADAEIYERNSKE